MGGKRKKFCIESFLPCQERTKYQMKEDNKNGSYKQGAVYIRLPIYTIARSSNYNKNGGEGKPFPINLPSVLITEEELSRSMILGNSSRCVCVAGLVVIFDGFVVFNCCASRSTVLSLSRLSLSKAGEPNGRLGKASRMVPLPLAPFSAVLLLGDDTTTDRPLSCIWRLLDLSQFSSAHKL